VTAGIGWAGHGTNREGHLISAPGWAADSREARGGAAGSIGLELALLGGAQSGDRVSQADERDDQSAACGSSVTDGGAARE
jgi:hypothetical protein